MFSYYKDNTIKGRYVDFNTILPLLNRYSNAFKIETVGYSVASLPIKSIEIGSGPIKILMWSQMHGNESTTTKALFDILLGMYKSDAELTKVLSKCTLLILPILNPDGANAYTRVNANTVDLNRDAIRQTQPESKALMQCFKTFQPNYCFNLHGQRSIFGVAETDIKPASLSFLAPAADAEKSLTTARKVAMHISAAIANVIQNNTNIGIGRYDDTYNSNCVGDTFMGFNVPTILFESGHCIDYQREDTRVLTYHAILEGIKTICNTKVFNNYKAYFNIPENKKLYFDIILRDVFLDSTLTQTSDIAIQYTEELVSNTIAFKPKISRIGDLKNYRGHKEFIINTTDFKASSEIAIGNEIDFVLVNTTKISFLIE